jgi:hypothetical protein
MAAPERFAESQISSCPAGTVHKWLGTVARRIGPSGRYRGNTGHGGPEPERQKVTLIVVSLPSIDALQKVHSPVADSPCPGG